MLLARSYTASMVSLVWKSTQESIWPLYSINTRVVQDPYSVKVDARKCTVDLQLTNGGQCRDGLLIKTITTSIMYVLDNPLFFPWTESYADSLFLSAFFYKPQVWASRNVKLLPWWEESQLNWIQRVTLIKRAHLLFSWKLSTHFSAWSCRLVCWVCRNPTNTSRRI